MCIYFLILVSLAPNTSTSQSFRFLTTQKEGGQTGGGRQWGQQVVKDDKHQATRLSHDLAPRKLLLCRNRSLVFIYKALLMHRREVRPAGTPCTCLSYGQRQRERMQTLSTLRQSTDQSQSQGVVPITQAMQIWIVSPGACPLCFRCQLIINTSHTGLAITGCSEAVL